MLQQREGLAEEKTLTQGWQRPCRAAAGPAAGGLFPCQDLTNK